MSASANLPIIRDDNKDYSEDCPCKGGLKELHRIHRTLPPIVISNEDADVLQDEAGAAVNDETDNGFIFDDLRV